LTQRATAVVIGDDVAALGLVRSLAKGGVRVVIVSDHVRRPVVHSRYARPFLVRAISGMPLVDGLLALKERLDGHSVLFLTNEKPVRAISEHRDRLKDAYRIRLPAHDRLCELLHKSSFQRIAEQYGFPVPRAIAVRGGEDIKDLTQLRFPVIVKPGTKDFIGGDVPRACRVSSVKEAEALSRRILASASDLIVQEWIEGAESDIYFCLQYRGADGDTVTSFVGRKLRCWPPQVGSTASCVAAPDMAAVLEPLTIAFFDRVGFVGMCGMEYKRDRRTGKLLMVEPTVGRIDYQEEVATICGTNIPLAAYCYEVGLPVPAADRIRDRLIWRCDPLVYWRCVIASRSLRDERPQRAKMKGACWRLDDPIPLVFFLLEWVQDLWHFCSRRALPMRFKVTWLAKAFRGMRRAVRFRRFSVDRRSATRSMEKPSALTHPCSSNGSIRAPGQTDLGGPRQ
jgi:predicted ATP-grasp superfamily ATP-dependent carboligase